MHFPSDLPMCKGLACSFAHTHAHTHTHIHTTLFFFLLKKQTLFSLFPWGWDYFCAQLFGESWASKLRSSMLAQQELYYLSHPASHSFPFFQFELLEHLTKNPDRRHVGFAHTQTLFYIVNARAVLTATIYCTALACSASWQMVAAL